MYPILFKIGPFTIYSYGLMVAIGFLVASYVLSLEIKRKQLDASLVNTITAITMVAGIVGSKLLYVIENWRYTVLAPVEMIFSPSGLTYYGGFILATLAVYVFARIKRLSFFVLADAIVPTLMLGYGIARLGCHFSGDGDYGYPTDLPWGTNYENGTYPPSSAFRDFPEIRNSFPDGIIPDNLPCHPTPVYEFLICALLFFVMWKMRSKISASGKMFALYLLLAGAERFMIEFIRINERIYFGLSEAQLISAGIFILGILFWNRNTDFNNHPVS
ncbi:MAG: prolipoprotein diacylglyceryl transferase [Bacteroidota bacterium]